MGAMQAVEVGNDDVAFPPFRPFHSIWENERVVPILDDDGQIDGAKQEQQAQQAQQQQATTDSSSSSSGGAPLSSRAWRSRWRMESRYADLLVAASEFPFCAWDATTYVLKSKSIDCRTDQPGNDRDRPFTISGDRDASIYTPLLLDPNAVYQPQLLSFAAHPDRVYRIEAK